MSDRLKEHSSNVYRVSKFWKIVISITMIPILGAYVFALIMGLLSGESGENLPFLAWSGAMAAFLLLFYALTLAFKTRLELLPDRIRDVGVFRSRELLLFEIKGFRIIQASFFMKAIWFIPEDPQTKKIKKFLIFEKQAQLLEWVSENLHDLDTVDAEEEISQLLVDERLGAKEEQRVSRLETARKWSRGLNIVSLIATAWAVFVKWPFELSLWVLVVFPILSVLSLRFFPGAIKFEPRNRSVYPSTAISFAVPTGGLALRALLGDWNILSLRSFWFPFALLSTAIFGLVLLCAEDIRQKTASKIAIFAVCMAFGYGAVICVNGILDSSTPICYKAVVTGKRVEEGPLKLDTYHLKLTPWGPRDTVTDSQVSASVFKKRSAGESVDVFVYQGGLGIAWFNVR